MNQTIKIHSHLDITELVVDATVKLLLSNWSECKSKFSAYIWQVKILGTNIPRSAYVFMRYERAFTHIDR